MRLWCSVATILLGLLQPRKSITVIVVHCLLTNRFPDVEFVQIHPLMVEHVVYGYAIVGEVRGCVGATRIWRDC